jgi:hypothetical protein
MATMIEAATNSSALEIARRLDGSELRGSERGSWRVVIMSAEPVRPRAGWFHLTAVLA